MSSVLTMLRNPVVHLTLVAVSAGICLGVGTLLFALWPLSLVGFAGVVYLVHNQTDRCLLPYLMLVGVIAYGCSFYSLYWSTLPLDWLGLGSTLGVAIISSVWLLTIVIFSVSLSAVMTLARGRLQTPLAVLLLPASLYVLAEAVGTFVFSLVLSGPAGTIGLDFSMGSLGYQLADSDMLRQVAWFGGLYGLLWVQAFLGTLLYFAVFVLRGLGATALIGAWLVVWVLLGSNLFSLPVATTKSTESLSVGVVSTYDQATTQFSQIDQIDRSLATLPNRVDVVALPEDARFVQQLGGSWSGIEQVKQRTEFILDSTTLNTNQGLAAQTQMLRTGDLTIATSSKDFLMVFGEYMPWLYRLIAIIIGQSDVVAQLESKHGYQTSQSSMFTIEQSLISVKLCSDGMSPFLYAKDTQAGAAILFNLASHGWFHQSQAMHDLAIRVGQVRAVESSRWYVRAGHDSPGFIIDHRGQVQQQSGWFEQAPLVDEVPLRSAQTPYTHLRGWVLALPLLIVLALVYPSARAKIAGRID